jgi:hypothetical protein
MTTRAVAQVTFAAGVEEGDKERVVGALDQSRHHVQGVVASHAAVHTELSVGGGDLTWDLLLSDDAAVEAFCDRTREAGPAGVLFAMGGELATLAPLVASVELAIPNELASGLTIPGLVGVKRTLWLRVEPGMGHAALARFEHETPLLARAVPAIRNWRWSRVRTLPPNPMETRWTHLWEQEFETIAGLAEDYMSSPCHWGYIDRWFDPEMPDRVVDLWLAHLSCLEKAPVLSWGWSEGRSD